MHHSPRAAVLAEVRDLREEVKGFRLQLSNFQRLLELRNVEDVIPRVCTTSGMKIGFSEGTEPSNGVKNTSNRGVKRRRVEATTSRNSKRPIGGRSARFRWWKRSTRQDSEDFGGIQDVERSGPRMPSMESAPQRTKKIKRAESHIMHVERNVRDCLTKKGVVAWDGNTLIMQHKRPDNVMCKNECWVDAMVDAALQFGTGRIAWAVVDITTNGVRDVFGVFESHISASLCFEEVALSLHEWFPSTVMVRPVYLWMLELAHCTMCCRR